MAGYNDKGDFGDSCQMTLRDANGDVVESTTTNEKIELVKKLLNLLGIDKDVLEKIAKK